MDEMDEHYNDENDQGQQLQYKDTNQQLTTLSSLTSLSSFVLVMIRGKGPSHSLTRVRALCGPNLKLAISKHSQMYGVSVRAM